MKTLTLTTLLLVNRCIPCIGASGETPSLEYPCQLVAISNPDNDCWTGMDKNGIYPVPVVPEQWLVGTPPSDKSGVTLPTDHWVDLGFCGPIGDGPGPDIIMTEQGRMGEQALILVGDGQHCPYPIGIAKADTTGDQAATEIGIDLSGLTLPFAPTTIRVVSLGLGGASPGFDVGSVRARIVPSQTPLAAYAHPPDKAADFKKVEDFESSNLAWQFHEGWEAVASVSRRPDHPVYEGCQSMAMNFKVYLNIHTGLIHVFDTGQDWKVSGAKVLELAFQGRQGNPEMARPYLRLSDGRASATVYYDGNPNAITDPQWHIWRIPLRTFSELDLSQIRSLVLGVFGDPNGPPWPVEGVVYFDSIALSMEQCDQAQCRRTDLNCDCHVDHRDLGQIAGCWLGSSRRTLSVQEPNRAVAWYRFEGNTDDSIGLAHGQIEGLACFAEGRIGQALSLSGMQGPGIAPDHMRITNVRSLFQQIKMGLTIAFWQLGKDSTHWIDTLVCSDFEYGKTDPAIHIALGCWDRPGQYQWSCGNPWTIENSLCGNHKDTTEWAGRWNHWTFVKDQRSGRMDVFLNGSLYASRQGLPSDLTGTITELTIGTGWYGYYDGLIDELQIYDYPLCQAEAAYLATDGSGILDIPLGIRADINEDDRIDWQDFALMALDWLAGPVTY